MSTDVLSALAGRTFRHAVESPLAYVVAIFFYGFVGGIYGLNFFQNNQASVSELAAVTPWVLWFVIPALTMGLLADEVRSGTFEQLATCPVRDGEIVLGKFLGFAALALLIITGLIFYPVVVRLVTDHPTGLDWGACAGMLAGLFLVSLFYGAMGIFASSLARNPVVALIIGMIFCTFFFFIGQFYTFFPGPMARIADFFGVVSHLDVLAKGVWDLRDLLYFASMTAIFLYFTVQRLQTRRF